MPDLQNAQVAAAVSLLLGGIGAGAGYLWNRLGDAPKNFAASFLLGLGYRVTKIQSLKERGRERVSFGSHVAF